MRYYVTADVHGFFSELKAALDEAGFFEDKEPHKLIICGDIYDRGSEAPQLQEFLLDLMARDEVILIRGNHEDLAEQLLNRWHGKSYLDSHHNSNGTVGTVCQLTQSTIIDIFDYPDRVGRAFLQNPYIQTIIPATVDYFETEHYIFVHGWIPCSSEHLGTNRAKYVLRENWRQADEYAWNRARWVNGMEAAHYGAIEPGKTIVCGHWHTSFGHSKYEGDGGEFEANSNFSPYYGEGIIALDACTNWSGIVNCIVIED